MLDSNLYWIHWNDRLHPLEWDGEAGGQKVNGWTFCQPQSGRSACRTVFGSYNFLIDVRWGGGGRGGADGRQAGRDVIFCSVSRWIGSIRSTHVCQRVTWCAPGKALSAVIAHTQGRLQQPRSDPARHSRPWFVSIIFFFCEFVAFRAFLISSHTEGSWSAVENDRLLWQHELVFYLVLARRMSETFSRSIKSSHLQIKCCFKFLFAMAAAGFLSCGKTNEF